MNLSEHPKMTWMAALYDVKQNGFSRWLLVTMATHKSSHINALNIYNIVSKLPFLGKYTD